jgi:hypothetical protein
VQLLECLVVVLLFDSFFSCDNGDDDDSCRGEQDRVVSGIFDGVVVICILFGAPPREPNE